MAVVRKLFSDDDAAFDLTRYGPFFEHWRNEEPSPVRDFFAVTPLTMEIDQREDYYYHMISLLQARFPCYVFADDADFETAARWQFVMFLLCTYNDWDSVFFWTLRP